MAKRIDKLTPEQSRRMSPWRDAWIARGLSTAPMEDEGRRKVESTIRDLYRRAKLAEPKAVIFVPSPLVLRIASGIAAGVIYAHRHGWPKKDSRGKASAAVDSAVRSAVDSAVDSAEDTHVEYLLRCARDAGLMERGGNLWAAFPAYLSFFRDVCELELAEWEAFAAIEATQTECGPYTMHADFAMVSDRPSILKRAPSGQLHSDDGPALAWRDGWSLYFWKGLRIPAALIEKRREMGPQEIASISNAEERRAAMEIYGHVHGPGAFVRDFGAKLISEDTAQGRPQQLYEAPTGDRYLWVINGSLEPDGTRREFLLGAHPEARTPHAAVAASYGRPAEKYKEAVRT